MKPTDNLFFEKLDKTDKKKLIRFYKTQNYSASLLGFDNCYVIKNNNEIIAAVIISGLVENNVQCFLHALVVNRSHQKQGLATSLLQYVQNIHQGIICFVDPELATLYLNNSFKFIDETQLPSHLLIRYKSYTKKHNKLVIFKYA